MKINPPEDRVGIERAEVVTGYSRKTILPAARRGEIPDANQRVRKSAWSFTESGLRRWIGIKADAANGDAA